MFLPNCVLFSYFVWTNFLHTFYIRVTFSFQKGDSCYLLVFCLDFEFGVIHLSIYSLTLLTLFLVLFSTIALSLQFILLFYFFFLLFMLFWGRMGYFNHVTLLILFYVSFYLYFTFSGCYDYSTAISSIADSTQSSFLWLLLRSLFFLMNISLSLCTVWNFQVFLTIHFISPLIYLRKFPEYFNLDI